MELVLGIFILLSIVIIYVMTKIIFAVGNVYFNIFVFIRNIKFKIRSKYLDLITMDRDINVIYSPALLSYLYNYKLEPKKDILATVLNLYNKKIIDIQYINNKYQFIIKENIDLSRLTEDEKYIFYTIVSGSEKEFLPDVWKKIVVDEYNEKFRIYKINKKITRKTETIISLICAFFLTWFLGKFLLMPFGLRGLENENSFIRVALFILGYIIFYIPSIMIGNTICYSIIPNFQLLKKKLNLMEKSELLKWLKFENFIKKYTLLSERKIEEIVLFEKYIPYAMVLNVNKEYENKDIQGFVKFYMKNVKRNIKSHIDLELYKKADQKYTFK